MNPGTDQPARARLTISGAVQGVGFRPWVYRLASELALAGWVTNTAQGVTIELEGNRYSIEKFLRRVEAEKPPRSIIQSMDTVWLAPVGIEGFTIRASDSGGANTALVLPDLATCPDCLREILEPGNRRYRYPFTNCTQCGPRFSIIAELPYDRPNTTMRGFAMCEACQGEYEDPLDRRFHAQPNACPECGPHLEWWDPAGRMLATRDEALGAAASALADGRIVAVKGLGGFHLMVDARNNTSVSRLRMLKHREEKPFAVMLASVEQARKECAVSEIEERLLRSPEAPIVLLRCRAGSLASAVAPGNPFLGVMLAYTPLHHLLLERTGFPVVATSGNRVDEPICNDEGEALERLSGIADFFLVHNRPILRSVDDSVARVALDRNMLLRRARGYAPLPVPLQTSGQTILAVGAHLKNTIALAVGESAFMSQHLGDLETTEAFAAHHAAIADFQRLYQATPALIAADAHPDYLSTKGAADLAALAGARLVSVQHHYAHVLSCMADNQIGGSVLGIAWDGTGYGLDGTIWGGEFLKVNGHGFERFAHLRTFPLPGGESAVREPRRCALGLLYEILGEEVFEMTELACVRAFTAAELKALRPVLNRKVNSPLTSSMGRLFDAVAALIGLRQIATFEGQAAMDLEWSLSGKAGQQAYSAQVRDSMSGSPLVLDWEPAIRAILADLRAEVPVAEISARFHEMLVQGIVQVAKRSGEKQIVLSGGCFQNQALLTGAVARLLAEGFSPFFHQNVPTNDGGIALGQLVAAGVSIKAN